MNCTIAIITARREPQLAWIAATLERQLKATEHFEWIVVDFFADDIARREMVRNCFPGVRHTAPKPTIWQGPHRLTRHDYWAASNARNTAICLCRTDWIVFLDDRLALGPKWMQALRSAYKHEYVLAGAYNKVHNLRVGKDGSLGWNAFSGHDSRWVYTKEHWPQLRTPFKAPGEWTYGCSLALPLQWALEVNGFDETCDSTSGEDYVFGLMLQNCGRPIYYDTRFRVVEDRTPAILQDDVTLRGNKGTLIACDKGVSPNDKSHALLDRLKDKRRAIHQWNLEQIRLSVLSGGSWPIPTGPAFDWFDGQPLSEM